MDSRVDQLDSNNFIKKISDISDALDSLKNRQYIGGVGVKTNVIPVTKLVKQNFGGGSTILSTDSRDWPADAPYNFKHTLAALGAGSSNGTFFTMNFAPDNQEFPVVTPGAFMYIDSPSNLWDTTDFTSTGVYGGFYVQQSYAWAWQSNSGTKRAGQSWTIEENKPVFTNWNYNVQRWTSTVVTTIYIKAFVISSDTGTLELITDDSTFGFNDA